MEKGLKIVAEVTLKEYVNARELAKNMLIQIVRLNEGFIPTIPAKGKLNVFMDVELDDWDKEYHSIRTEQIYGFRYVEGEGLFVCTKTCLENYEYDNNYRFSQYDCPQGEDLEHINKALENLAYYTNFDDESIVLPTSLLTILSSIQSYL